jgi:hypothetical protein
MGSRAIVVVLENKVQSFEEAGVGESAPPESEEDLSKGEGSPPALIESPTAICGSGTPAPPRKMVITARATMLR